MPSYKLYYFNIRGRAEVCRLLFALTGTEYEDKRFEKGSDEWKAFKVEALTGQVPVLEVDGRRFSQSVAIGRYLAREFGLYGVDHTESLRIDEILGAIEDLVTHIGRAFFLVQEESKKAEAVKDFREKHSPIYLSAFVKLLEQNGTGFLVGPTVTLADIAVYDLVFTLSTMLTELPEMYPALKEHSEKIQNLDGIKEYVAKRPKTPH